MALEQFRVDGKVAVITGAGRGIGAASARVLAEAGADVVITARTKEQLGAVAAEIEGLGRRTVVFPSDVSEPGALEALVAAAVDELGGVDIVVNNAGGTMPRPFLDTSPRFLEEAFHFNVTT